MASSQASRDPIRRGPDDDKYYFKDVKTTGPSLAGLLEFPNTKDMGKWLNSQADKDLWAPYSEFPLRGFGSLTSKAIPISLKECMLWWGLEDTRALVTRRGNAEK
ncbi:MAG: hypothetical protein M1839_005604 [Geoglossum umbratile]|nr:MAG: hypothetical protein M1839_005604 [Geoglossum umbratile]